MSELRRLMARGAMWLLIARLADRSLGMLSIALLARLLAPSDFGVVAMAGALVAATELLRAFGFEVALIQSQDATRAEYDTAWTLNAALGAAIALLVAGLAYPGAAFYGDPRLAPVLLALALRPALQGLRNVGVVNFRKELKFHLELRLSLATKIIGLLATVPTAYVLRSYWALVCGILVSAGADLLLSYAMHPFRPRPSLRARAELMHFSKWMFLNNLGFFFGQRAPDLILGKLAGARALGLFSLSYELANLPTTELVSTINGATFPGYSRHGREPARLREDFLEVMGFVFLLALPAGVGLILVADRAVALLLGEAWIDAAPVVQILACAGLLNALATNTGYVYMALGKPRHVTLVTASQLTFLLPAVAAGTLHSGVHGAAWAYVAAACTVALPLNCALVSRELALPLGQLARRLWRPLVGSATMAWCVWSVRGQFLDTSRSAGLDLAQLLLLAATGVAAYVGAVMLLWTLADKPAGAESSSIRLVRARLSQLSVR